MFTARNRRSILLLAAAAVGAVGGAVAAAFHHALHIALDLLWKVEPGAGADLTQKGFTLVAICAAGGLLVGGLTRLLGRPGEIEAVVDNVHWEGGRLPIAHAPRMALIAFVSILFGGSAGPEAPLVQVIGSLGSALGDRLRLSNDEVRILTLSGMAAALGAFFGAPLAGAVFALELPHQRGLEFFEALMPAVLSASVAFVVFDAFVPVSHPLLHFGSDLSIAYGSAVPFAILLGALGAAIGACFQIAFDGLGSVTRRFDERPVLLATCGGALLGAIALLTPRATGMTTLFWGEPQLVHFSTQLASGNVTNLGRVALPWLALAALELLSISITLRSGFRGGFIFPLLFVGALVGAAAHALSGGRIPLPVAVMCTMVAVNVAVTKTPLGTAILLGTLSGTALLPLILVASLTSFFLAGPVRVIRSQRSRTEPDHVERTEPRRHTASTALLAEQAARAGLPPT